MYAIVGEINGDAPIRLLPVRIDWNHGADKRAGDVEQRNGKNSERDAGGPAELAGSATGHELMVSMSFKKGKRPMLPFLMLVGATGFEPATPTPPV